MSDKMELFVGLIVLLAVIALTRKYHAWRIRRAYQLILDDLRTLNALTPGTAVDLPYAGKNLLRIGLRDHRKMALNHLVLEQVVGQTDEGRYYLIMDIKETPKA
jgi:hypothetical protein